VADVPLAALAIQPPQVAAGGGAQQINPFQAGLDIMRMRQLGNENQQFQLHQWGLKGAGEIMAAHPGDEEAGLKELMASPYAPYAIDFAQSARQGFLALTQAHAAQAQIGMHNLEFGDKALTGFMKGLGPYATALQSGNASQEQLDGLLNNAINMTIATTAGGTPAQRAQAALTVRAIAGSLTGTPQEQLQKLRSLIGTTLDATAVSSILGSPVETETNAGRYRGTYSPVTGQTTYTTAIPNTAPPGFQEPGRFLQGAAPPTGASSMPAPIDLRTGQPQAGFPTLGGGYTGAGGAGNALGGTGGPLPPTPPVGTGGPTMQPIVTRPTEGPIGADGKPLYTDKTDWGTPPEMEVGTGGERRLTSPTDREMADTAVKEYSGPEARAFSGYQSTMAQLQFMDADLDKLAGTPFEPGFEGERRLQMGNAWNTALNTLHSFGLMGDDAIKSLSFDKDLLAAGDSFVKAQTLAQFATTVQNFGAQREAAQVIMRSLTAVPNMNNTLMGDKLVLEGLKALARRGMEYRDFQNEYMQHHNGSLAGADIAFKKEHPAEGYAQKILDNFGLSSKGFNSRGDINNAVRHGYIDPKQAPMFFKQVQEREKTTTQAP